LNLNFNHSLALVDKSEEDEADADDYSDDDAPNEQLVARTLPVHLLGELLVSLLHVVGRTTQVFIDNFHFLALNLRLRLDVASDVPHVTHQ